MYIHLRLHSEFSVVDGTVRIPAAVKAAAADGQGALALSDFNNMFGAIKFYKKARAAGVKPVLGAEIALSDWPGSPQERVAPMAGSRQLAPRVLLLVQNDQGYLNLCELLARAWTQNVVRDQAQVRWAWLQELNEGLIVLAGAQAGPIGRALLLGDEAAASACALAMAQVFTHRFYIEVQRAGRDDDERHVQAAAALAARLGLPVVATHPVQFLSPDDFESHEARVCIAEGEILGNKRRVRRFTPQQYFKSTAEMQALFADLPSALANTVEIAKRCNLSLTLGKPQLPNFPTPEVDGVPMPMADYFRQLSFEGLEDRLALLYPHEADRDAQRPSYVARLEFEINTILQMGFPGYFLIVGDFINWAKNNGCPVGPGRGSGAGSLVAYALKITDLDPLRYNLLFERFLNPERVSMPDFDIDFCQSNRDRVIEYVKQRYGRDAVSQIATFGTMAARAAVRDVGRVLDFSYGFCDGISKLIPNKPGTHITIAEAIEQEPALAERVSREEEVRQLLTMAQKLEGMTRNIGMHAGGVLIAPGKLTDFCPLYQQPGSESAVSQFDKDDVESAGLVKFDFLGLATLTILELAREFISARHEGMADFQFERVPLDDHAVYELFSRGQTEAVFQFESRGMQGMLRDAQPSRLEDLIALNALYRPGPMDLIPSFVARKHGREEVVYPHPSLAEMLSETYGIMVYQEQVMQTAQIMAGYSLGGADMLRRAMGKKKPEEMVKQREIFRAGAAEKGTDQATADEVFDLMEKFAGYGFNKSHAAAYSLLAYHTAWVKVHYTAEFYAANMTIEMDNTDKLKVLVQDAKIMGITFEAPDVNRGVYRFEPISDHVVRYGLGAIKGTGEQAIEAIVAARQAGGAFNSFFDFVARIDKSKVNKRTIEALIRAGALDSLAQNRAALIASLERAMDYAAAQAANADQVGLFDLLADATGSSTEEPQMVPTLPWGVRERLMQEKSALGFFLSGHLFDEAEAEVRQFAKTPMNHLVDSRDPVLLAGVVSDLRMINGQRGKLILFKLDDKTDTLEASVDEALYNAQREVLKDDQIVVLQAVPQPDRFSGGLRLKVQRVWDMGQARCRFGKYLLVEVGARPPAIGEVVQQHAPKRDYSDEGHELVQGLQVRLRVLREAVEADIALDDRALFYPSDAALQAWRAQALGQSARVIYSSEALH
jgi:DNA polymerase-3 subunit alpha